MHLIGKITATNVIPEPLKKLEAMAYNLWWSWNPEFLNIFRLVDNDLWLEAQGNPVRFLQEVSNEKLEAALDNPELMKSINLLSGRYEDYISNANTWFSLNHGDKSGHFIAYFSAEYGLNDVLPIYSGALGILSGDHCKSASDLGLPFAGIGLLYREGYFSQNINRDGWQETHYKELNFNRLPVKPTLSSSGDDLIISVEIADKVVYAKVWEVMIGRVPLFLIDTDINLNTPVDRLITGRLSGGDFETRIKQEILLGIGGIRVLSALGIKPSVYHMNEAHSAFMGLELISGLVKESGLSFREAREVACSSIVFTAHTPVPAGSDVYPVTLIDKYLPNYWDTLGISRHEFLDLGIKAGGANQDFNMSILALNLSGFRNGVSGLHGAVLRNMYSSSWPGIPEEEVPISHITSGIHIKTWLAPEISALIDKYTGSGWENGLNEKEMWEQIDKIHEQELWETHKALKIKSMETIRNRLKEQAKANGSLPQAVREIETALDPEVLTIGFARRFTSFKRANLIFRNAERIQKLLNSVSRPVQIIFAGKAHPSDRSAQEIIKNIYDETQKEGFKGKVFLLENYDIETAKILIQGCDIWLTNTRRPLEVSGTSGQKAGLNGSLNLSVLDGWWVEGYNGRNGWVIGSETFYDNEKVQDDADSESLLSVLENQITPLYYSRNEKCIPSGWVHIMKESIKSIGYQYNTSRMVKEYFENAYYPCMERMDKILDSNFEHPRKMAAWKSSIEKGWKGVRIYSVQVNDEQVNAAQPVKLSAVAQMEEIDPSGVRLEVCYGKLNSQGEMENYETEEMQLEKNIDSKTYLYSSYLIFSSGGEYGYSVRALPYHPDLSSDFELKLIRWAT